MNDFGGSWRRASGFGGSQVSVISLGAGASIPGVGWGETGDFYSLSTTVILNDTATNSTAGGWSIAGSDTAHSSGSYYAEIKIISTSNNRAMFGIVDDTTGGGSSRNNYFALVTNSAGIDSSGAGYSNGADYSATSSTSFSVNVNDIFGICYKNGNVWITRNGSAILGDPVAGTGAPITISNTHAVNAAAATLPTSSDVIQLITGSAALSFLPSGYTAWG